MDLATLLESAHKEAAEILFQAFKANWPTAWPTLEDALEEVRESFGQDRISRAAVDEQGRVLGWIGGISGYDGHAWELHPLAVDTEFQGQGIGTRLMEDFEEQVQAKGAITIFLGSDDENNMTSLGNADLYPDVLSKTANIHDLKRHPFRFYQKMGYVLVGVIPDANGFGKPDILMAKRVGKL